jgi:hypothetical protein
VGGTWPETGTVAFFLDGHPRALPGFPDGPRASVNPFSEWRDRFGAILCVASNSFARAGVFDTECERDSRAWLLDHAIPIDHDAILYRATGWRYLSPVPKNVTVFWLPPAAEAAGSASGQTTR